VLALYNYYGLVAPRLSLHNFWFHINSACFYVLREFPAALSAHRAPGEKAAVPMYKVLVRPGRTLDLPAPKRTHLPIGHGLVQQRTEHGVASKRTRRRRSAPGIQGNALNQLIK